jgi:hypothetical protein
LPDKDDHLYIDGYPRSGNSYTVGYLRKALPNFNFASHLHSRAALKITLRYNLPTFIIIRTPEDTIASNLYLKMTKNYKLDKQLVINEMLLSYISYYKFVKEKLCLDKLYVMTFNSCTKSELNVINKIYEIVSGSVNNRYEIQQILIQYKHELKQMEQIKESHASSLPNKKRQIFKDQNIKKIQQSSYFNKAFSLYQNLEMHDMTMN